MNLTGHPSMAKLSQVHSDSDSVAMRSRLPVLSEQPEELKRWVEDRLRDKPETAGVKAAIKHLEARLERLK